MSTPGSAVRAEVPWEQVIARLEKGWCQRRWGGIGEKMCLATAVAASVNTHVGSLRHSLAIEPLVKVVREQWPERALPREVAETGVPLVQCIVNFNDHPKTVLTDVIAACEKARADA